MITNKEFGLTINEKQFSALCYLILMEHHGQRIFQAAPQYIEEKLSMLKTGYNAYGYLDRPNQLKVLAYLDKWQYAYPEIIKKEEDYLKDVLRCVYCGKKIVWGLTCNKCGYLEDKNLGKVD